MGEGEVLDKQIAREYHRKGKVLALEIKTESEETGKRYPHEWEMGV